VGALIELPLEAFVVLPVGALIELPLEAFVVLPVAAPLDTLPVGDPLVTLPEEPDPEDGEVLGTDPDPLLVVLLMESLLVD